MLPLRKFEKNRMAHFRELDHNFDFGYIEPNDWLGGRSGPLPAPKSPKIPQKEAATKAWQGGRSGPLPAPKKPKIPQKEAAT